VTYTRSAAAAAAAELRSDYFSFFSAALLSFPLFSPFPSFFLFTRGRR